MTTTIDQALTRYAVVGVSWNDFSHGNYPILGAFLAGWFCRDMGLEIPENLPAVGRDSFRKAWSECDSLIAILEQQNKTP